MAKRITIKEISELANTSKTTVSFYLSGQYHKMSKETKARIEQAIKETNYIPNAAARRLGSEQSNLVGVIIGDVSNIFASQLIKGIDTQMKNEKYQMILGNSNYSLDNEKALLEQMMKMNVDGLIVQPTTQFRSILKSFKNFSKPIVYVDSPLSSAQDVPAIQSMTVKSNTYEAVLDAIEQMIKIGYEEFIMFTGDPSILSTRLERAQGFYDALELKNIEYKTCIVPEDVKPEFIHEYVSNTLKLSKKTCVFIANCWLLPIVYKGISSFRYLIPNTIGVLGFDNTEWTNFSFPTVTTIVQPAEEEGKAACRILIDVIEGRGNEVPNQILKCHLNVKESTSLNSKINEYNENHVINFD